MAAPENECGQTTLHGEEGAKGTSQEGRAGKTRVGGAESARRVRVLERRERDRAREAVRLGTKLDVLVVRVGVAFLYMRSSASQSRSRSRRASG